MEPGTIVSFKEEEPVLCEDGSVHKWRDFTVRGVVEETLPDGKVRVRYTHPSFDMDAVTTRDPKYLTVVEV